MGLINEKETNPLDEIPILQQQRETGNVRLQEKIAPVQQGGYGKLLQRHAAGKITLMHLGVYNYLHIHSSLIIWSIVINGDRRNAILPELLNLLFTRTNLMLRVKIFSVRDLAAAISKV